MKNIKDYIALFGGNVIGFLLGRWISNRFTRFDRNPVKIRSDKHNPKVNLTTYQGRELARFHKSKELEDFHYCGEKHNIGDECVEDIFLPGDLILLRYHLNHLNRVPDCSYCYPTI
jgi:hypothetical protein